MEDEEVETKVSVSVGFVVCYLIRLMVLVMMVMVVPRGHLRLVFVMVDVLSMMDYGVS